MNDILIAINRELEKAGTETVRESGRRFFREAVRLHGVKTAEVKKIGRRYFAEIKGKSKSDIFRLCDELWRSGYMEESFIACQWSYSLRKKYEPGDFITLEHWVDSFVTNWASCDTLCNHTIGAFLEMYPQYLESLTKWARSSNRWMRRASAVSLIVPAKKGRFLGDIFKIADILLADEDDLVQKGYGWMLKAASHSAQDEVFRYVMERKALMPRTALRYAIEKMPRELKIEAMKK